VSLKWLTHQLALADSVCCGRRPWLGQWLGQLDIS
jgi:hypothetical protein